MKATCKLCNRVIETDPDPNMDEGREQRELTAFWNRLAFHIDPRNAACTVTDHKLVKSRFAMVQQDNGWFQRFRLLACVTTEDPKLVEKQKQWRLYLNTITAGMPDVDIEAPMSFKPDQVM